MGQAYIVGLSFIVFLLPAAAAAQNVEGPGVTQIAPGVARIDGNSVPSQPIDAGELEAAIKATPSLRAIKRRLGEGISYPGPEGSTTYMYKIHDTASDADRVVILFTKRDAIVDYLIQ